MKYFKSKWIHNFKTDPVWIYFEVDSDRWETRKVEVFPDGEFAYADAQHQGANTRLSEVQMPSVEEINTDPQFVASEISVSEFEDVWARATGEK